MEDNVRDCIRNLAVLVSCIKSSSRQPLNVPFNSACQDIVKTIQFVNAEKSLENLKDQIHDSPHKHVVLFDPPYMLDHEILSVKIYEDHVCVSSDGGWSGYHHVNLDKESAIKLAKEITEKFSKESQ